MPSTANIPFFLLLLLLLLPNSTALRFYLHDRERRCFTFQAPYDSRIIGQLAIANGEGTASLNLQVVDSTRHSIYETHRGSSPSASDHISSKFAFRTPAHHPADGPHPDDDYLYDDYLDDATFDACLVLSFEQRGTYREGAKRAVEFWIRADGRGAIPVNQPRAKEGAMGKVNAALEDMQTSLTRIVADLSALQQRERRLVRRTTVTASRLVIFAVLSLLVIVATSTLQFLHFRTYFKSKKLI